MKINNTYYLIRYLDALTRAHSLSTKSHKEIVTWLIKIFNCTSNIKCASKNLTLNEHCCYSPLAKYLTTQIGPKAPQSFTLTFVGQHTLGMTIQLNGSGLTFIEVRSTPEGELNPSLVLKTTSQHFGSLTKVLLSLLEK